MYFIFSIKQFNSMAFTNMEFFDICVRNSGKLKVNGVIFHLFTNVSYNYSHVRFTTYIQVFKTTIA
jgi:hypothetical protein